MLICALLAYGVRQVFSRRGSYIFSNLPEKHEEITNFSIEPHDEKACLPGLRPGKTQTGLRSHRSKLEA